MTDRRRNLFILLLVAGLLIAQRSSSSPRRRRREGLDLKGGVSLVYQAKPTKFAPQVTGDAIQRTLDIMRERVDQLGVAEPEILRSGSDQINVNLPDVKNADEAEQQVGQVAQMFFYDWEKNVLGDDGKPHPTDPAVTGDGQAGSGAGARSLYDVAEDRRPSARRSNVPARHAHRPVLRRRRQAADGRLRPAGDGLGAEVRLRGGPQDARVPHARRHVPRADDREGARGHGDPARRAGRRQRQAEDRPVVRPQGRPGPARHGHQEPRAELRRGRRRRTSRSTSRARAARRGRRSRARSPSAAARSTCPARTRPRPTSTSRSGWTRT